MQLRMLERRLLSGFMTVVGDIAQSTGQWAHQSWDGILELLPQKRPARRTELTLGYRLPAPIMVLASRVLRHAAPDRGAAPPGAAPPPPRPPPAAIGPGGRHRAHHRAGADGRPVPRRRRGH